MKLFWDQPPDHSLLSALSRLVIYIQNHWGIPKYQLQRALASLLFANQVYQLTHLNYTGKPLVLLIEISGNLIAASSLFAIEWQQRRPRIELQRKADRTGQIVSNFIYFLSTFCLGRMIIFLAAIISLILGVKARFTIPWSTTVGPLGWAVCMYLMSIHTFPMEGPRLKSRLKALFSIAKPITT